MRDWLLRNQATQKYITSLTKFRLSSHELLIEKGRHLHITREDRLCKYCNMNLVENEYHFLLVCPKYANLRKEHLTNYYCRWPTVEKVKNLMSSKSRNTLINLSKYIYFAFELRSEPEDI